MQKRHYKLVDFKRNVEKLRRLELLEEIEKTQILEAYKVFALEINEDSNEGKGMNVILPDKLYYLEEEARQFSNGLNVQGTAAWIKEIPLVKAKTSVGTFWLTVNCVNLVFPEEKLEEIRRRRAKRKIADRLLSENKISEEEYKILIAG